MERYFIFHSRERTQSDPDPYLKESGTLDPLQILFQRDMDRDSLNIVLYCSLISPKKSEWRTIFCSGISAMARDIVLFNND